MKNPLRTLHDIERELSRLSLQLTRVQLVHLGAEQGWRPALNAFRCDDWFVVCLELAGVDKDAIDVRAEPRRLVIRGTRVMPEPSCDEPPALNVLALEIDHGPFERVLDLPAEVDPSRVSAEHRNGLLWIKLPLRPQG